MTKLNYLYDTYIRRFLIPFTLIILTLNFTTILPYISLKYKNDFATGFSIGILRLVRESWKQANLFDFQIWTLIIYTLTMGTISILYFPGQKCTGPRTQSGFQPIYRNTSFLFYLVNMAISIVVISQFDMSGVYLKIVSFAGTLTLLGFLTAFLIYIKGLIAPSPGIFVRTTPIWDFYCGIELYPRLGNYLDLKQLINCRFGMWLWQLVILISWKAHHDFYKLAYQSDPTGPTFSYRLTANVLLQTIYIAKFFYWEIGYMQTIDISVDHFGYMIAWGCFAWVPTFYTLSSWIAVRTWPVNDYYNSTWFYANIVIGILSIWLNYETDRQRQVVRAKDGQCTIWFKKPKLIYANYIDEDGVKHRTILLASGFWSWARHINYLFELMAAFSWCFATGNNGLVAYSYFFFLLLLLVHRNLRDEEKCRKKYGKFWEQYCEQVKYNIIPYVY